MICAVLMQLICGCACNAQARMGGVQSCLIILRIFRDMCKRDTTWKPVTDWVSLTVIMTFSGLLEYAVSFVLRQTKLNAFH